MTQLSQMRSDGTRGAAVPQIPTKIGKLSKAILLARCLTRSPLEFCDRLETILEVQWDKLRSVPYPYDTVTLREALSILDKVLPRPVTEFLGERQLEQTEKQVARNLQWLRAKAPFTLKHNADFSLARVCYLICRTLASAVVLETGVAYGVSSTFLLRATQLNGQGRLSSIDLPPLAEGADQHVGFLVPSEVKQYWTLYRGSTKRLLPQLLRELKSVDVFVQDSLHTDRNISAELEMVWPFLRPGGVLVIDDIENNAAFARFAGKARSSCCIAVQEESKNSCFGILVKSA
jgi:predicted O-methyltransferase YrrM